jgi:hypothetical protein
MMRKEFLDLRLARRARGRITKATEEEVRGWVTYTLTHGSCTITGSKPRILSARFYRVREYWRALQAPVAAEAEQVTCHCYTSTLVLRRKPS